MAQMNRKVRTGTVSEEGRETLVADAIDAAPLGGPSGSLLERQKSLTLFDYMESLTEAERNQHMAYIYRVSPSSGPGVDTVYTRDEGMPSYIGKLTPPFDVDLLTKRYGGYVLQVKLKHRKTLIYDQPVKIEAGPVVQEMELQNPQKVQASAKPGGAAAGVAEQGMAGIFQQMMADYKDAVEKNRTFDVKQAFEDSLAMYKTAFTGALESATTQRTAAGPTALEQMAIAFMTRMMDRMDQAPQIANPLAQMEQMLKMFTMFQGLQETLGGGPKGSWMDTLVSKAPELLDKMKDLAAHLPRPIVVPRPGNGAATPGAGGVQTVPIAASPETDPGPAAEADETPFKQLLLRMLAAGKDGDEAAVVLDNWSTASSLFGRGLAAVLKAGDLAALAGDAILSQAPSSPGWIEFAKDFVDYWEPEPEATEAPKVQ